MHFSHFIALVAVVGLGASVPLGIRSADAGSPRLPPDTLDVDQVKPGMKGYGLTVFEGTEPAKFDVEIIDVLKNFRVNQDLILIKTPHPRLNVAKVVAGMSGSPIFINGKMIGAYAYGWPFGEEPVAGVTPIRDMLEDLNRPLPKSIFGWPFAGVPEASALSKPEAGPLSSSGGSSGGSNTSGRYDGETGTYDLRRHVEQLSKRRAHVKASYGSLAPVATPLLIGGMDAGMLEVARELLEPLGLEPLQAGGGGGIEPNAPTRFVDGGAIGVQMIRGDMSATGLGTVTRVDGDKLVAFGHPLMGGGVTAMPTAIGRVLWFLASTMRSFKMGLPVRPVGAMVNDRQASIVVSHSAKAPIVPVTIQIKGVPGAPRTDWKFEVSHEKFMTPSLVALALGAAVQATAAERQDVSWNAVSQLKIRGHGAIELLDYGVSIGGTPDPREFIASNLVNALGSLLNNPWEPAIIESVQMSIELRYAREMLRLRGVELLEQEVDAGSSVHARLTLVPYAGREIQQTVTIPIPRHLAGEKVTLEFEPGYLVQKERASPDTLTELVANLEDATYPPKSLVVGYNDGSGVAFRGRVATQLPPGAFDVLRPTSATIAPAAFESQTRHVVALDQFLIGKDRATLEVRPVRR